MPVKPKDTAFDSPLPAGADGGSEPPQDRTWMLVCLFLLAVTWLPLLSIHLYRTSLGDSGAGTVVVVFSPTLSSSELFAHVVHANGAPVSPVSWWRNAWIVHSSESGFAGRLRKQGAWGAFSTDLLSPEALLSCFRIAAPPASEIPDSSSVSN